MMALAAEATNGLALFRRHYRLYRTLFALSLLRRLLGPVSPDASGGIPVSLAGKEREIAAQGAGDAGIFAPFVRDKQEKGIYMSKV
ncbi:MAG: hypothetical protein LBU67_01870 [Oscillospiraceae bacterium]|jgi:hypothetical protein|nr:hypothetical protein [Oscillospiraceae bacterium]